MTTRARTRRPIRPLRQIRFYYLGRQISVSNYYFTADGGQISVVQFQGTTGRIPGMRQDLYAER